MGKAQSSFIEFVRTQPCCMGSINSGLSPKSLVNQTRLSDPHHLKSFTNNTRRYCDWFIVPLSRANHSWIDTYQGKLWEQDNVFNLYKYAGDLLVIHGVYVVNPFKSIETLRDDCYTVLGDYKDATNQTL